MSRRKASPAKPWSKKKAHRRVLSPDQQWAFGIVRKILLDCHPWQRDAVIDPAKRISMLVGRGGAKTTSQRARALIKTLLLPKQYVGYAAITADQARELNWEQLKSVCEAYDISFTGSNPDVTFLDTKMVMRCHRTGSVYRLRGVEDKRDAEKFRGFPQAEFQVDECGSFDPQLLEYLVDECVIPRLGQALTLPEGLLEQLADESVELDTIEFEPGECRGGAIVLGSSPPKRIGGIFYDVTRPGSDHHRPYRDRELPEYKDWIGYSSHAWNLRDVVALPDAKRKYPALVALREDHEREFKRKGWDEKHPTRLREYEGIWSEDNTTHCFKYRGVVEGRAFNQWDPFDGRPLEGLESLKLAVEKLPGDVGKFHYALGGDSGGTRDPYALNLFAFAPEDRERRLIHVFGMEKMRLYAKLIAEILIGPDPEKHPGIPKGGGLFLVTGWPDIIVFDSNQPLIDELANVYGIQAKKANKEADYKFGAIELTNGDFIAEKIKILKKSPLEKQLGELQWKADEYGILRENKAQANHCTDCLIYVRREVAQLFEGEAGDDDQGDERQQSKKQARDEYSDPAALDLGLRRDRGEDDGAAFGDIPDDFDDDAWNV